MSGNDQRDAIRSCYASWSESYFDDYLGSDADYWPVHVELIDQILTANNAGTILDVGCGPASMTRLLANKDREFYGFDLTPEMIMEAQKVGTEYDIPREKFWIGDSVDANSYWPNISSPPQKLRCYYLFRCFTAPGTRRSRYGSHEYAQCCQNGRYCHR